MAARNQLLTTPPFPVEQALTRLGMGLRTARVRRNLSIQEIADKIGTGPRAVRDAEKGKPSTGIGVYVALLWVYDLMSPFNEVANPNLDQQGLTLAAAKERKRARKSAGLDNDF
jgi:hypothetical protein